ncbi:MAG: MoxR family ATPase [Candidatus Caldarchaeum sp.]
MKNLAHAGDRDMVEHLRRVKEEVMTEIGKVIVGQRSVIELLLLSLFSSGHSLFVGVPGLAKTLLVSTLSQVLSLKFSRVQFTPDLMPSDITGSEVLDLDPDTGRRFFRFIPGPVFCNILLADEINRSSPKTQAALLQAMQERRVTAGGKTYDLPLPFLVFATQNPIEQEGTYPLPEAELDRFMFQIEVDYPSLHEEIEIVRGAGLLPSQKPRAVLGSEEILAFQALSARVPVPDHVAEYAVRIVRATRPRGEDSPQEVKKWVSWGVGPRASQFLVAASKARAVLEGRYAPEREDVKALAPSILRHRLVLNFKAQAEGVRAEDVINLVLGHVG